MSISDDGSNQLIHVTFRGGKRLTTAAFRAVAKKIKNNLGTGKQSLKRLSRSGAALQGVEVSNTAVTDFRQYAKKYKLDFSVIQHENDPHIYSLFFRQGDISKMEHAVDDFLKDSTLAHDGLDEKLQNAKNEALNINKARQKEKNRGQKKNVHRDKDTR